MSKKSQRYKRRAELERRRADSADKKASDNIKDILSGRRRLAIEIICGHGRINIPAGRIFDLEVDTASASMIIEASEYDIRTGRMYATG